MERCLHANGWGAMETFNEHRVFKFRGNKKGAISVAHNKWRVIIMIYWIRYISKAFCEIARMHAGFTVTGCSVISFHLILCMVSCRITAKGNYL